MKCKACKREIPDGSIFCLHCGEKVIRSRAKKKEVSVPKPRQLPSGTWFGRISHNGQRLSISAPTEAEYYAKAKAIRNGILKVERKKTKLLSQACEDYIDSRSSILSPATINGYRNITRNRFKAYMEKNIYDINWQNMVNDEADVCNAKTLKNAFGFIRSAVEYAGVSMPPVTLPQVVPNELAWLTPDQIPLFLNAIRDKSCELSALFALHGLRKSEFLALRPKDIYDGVIHITASRVLNSDNELVYKKETKNSTSRRNVYIRIPRLQELIDSIDIPEDEFYIKTNTNNIHWQINNVCSNAGLPLVGCHGLRRSFASLAYSLGWSERETMRAGGWADYDTMHKRYIKLSESKMDDDDAMLNYFKNIENGNESGNEK